MVQRRRAPPCASTKCCQAIPIAKTALKGQTEIAETEIEIGASGAVAAACTKAKLETVSIVDSLAQGVSCAEKAWKAESSKAAVARHAAQTFAITATFQVSAEALAVQKTLQVASAIQVSPEIQIPSAIEVQTAVEGVQTLQISAVLHAWPDKAAAEIKVSWLLEVKAARCCTQAAQECRCSEAVIVDWFAFVPVQFGEAGTCAIQACAEQAANIKISTV